VGTVATRANDPLFGGLPIGAGRHGGCQLDIDQAGALTVGTGDSAVGSLPQNLASLGGKTLRVNRFSGDAWPSNPFSGSSNPDTARILSYGHRNVQGVTIHPDTGEVWTVEHGPSRDDEVNRIVAGGNYGWNPVPGYNESVPMTDTSEFPGAITAAWSTGAPTLALSGASFLSSNSWGSWRNGLAVTALKNQSLRILFFTADGRYRGQRQVIDGEYGRLRAVAEGPDGSLYITTSNGAGQDKVLQVTP
jgi:glucose/arabinose dehydrogenase